MPAVAIRRTSNALNAYRNDGRVANDPVGAKQPPHLAHLERVDENIAMTVVDEAVIDETHLYVREGDDVARIELSALRAEKPRVLARAIFVFGKSTQVMFVNAAKDPDVAALRDRLAAQGSLETVERDEVSEARRNRQQG